MSSSTAIPIDVRIRPEPFSVAPELRGDRLTIVISGELDMATGSVLEDVQQAFRGRYRTIRYELADLTFMDSAGLSALLAPVDIHLLVSHISIAHPSPCVRRLLALRQMQELITG